MRFTGVFLVLVMLTLVFTTVSLGMAGRLTDCAYEPYYKEMSKSCDDVYSYNSVRFWSIVYLPNDVIVFTLAEGALIALLFSNRKQQPVIMCNLAFIALLLSAGMQIHGFTRHSKLSEDYTNFSEAYAAFSLLSLFCMFLVEILLMTDRAYNRQDNDEPDLIEPARSDEGQQALSTTSGQQPVPAGIPTVEVPAAAEPPPYSP